MTAGSLCPTCKSPIDPARAPVARIRDARVVTYCSTRCADAPTDAVEPAAASAPVSSSVSSSVLAGAPRRTEPVTPEVVATPVRPRPDRARARRRLIAVSAAVLLGGMVIAVIEAVSPSTPSKVEAARGARAVEAPPSPARAVADEAAPAEPAAPVEIDPARLRGKAEAALRQLLTSESPRVRRVAAKALSRLGDPAAIDILRALMDEEESAIARIEIAYALARAGDDSGKELLLASLKEQRRDVRLDAARALVLLGDDAGRRQLDSMLSLRTLRLGAAELLARLGEEEGLEILREAAGDDDASREHQMRAVVALGRVGDASVRDRLVEIMKDPEFHVGAAAALAALGDRAAVPALQTQLARTSLRVQAAIALRRLGAEVDLEPLAVALATESDVVRVSAAEAILILLGPKDLAERE